MISKIQSFLDNYYPEYVPPYYALAALVAPAAPAAPAAAAAPAYPSPAPMIYNPVIINPAPVPAAGPAAARPEKRDDRKPSGGQVLAAAGILTGGAVALSYLWHDGQHLQEMVQLKKELESAVLQADPNDAAIYNNMLRLLTLEIDYATRSRVSKLLGTGSLSLTAAGAAVATDFLISSLGIVGIAVSCGSLIVWANNYFDRRQHANERKDLIRAIRSALNYNPPGQAYKPSAPL